mmetsp:Transcript_46544/g.86472  ORF Transcript_46544/g.86472 Transcript_46544/m.86472 type:complete len:117 (-) Transcript_46544:50-400(-)
MGCHYVDDSGGEKEWAHWLRGLFVMGTKIGNGSVAKWRRMGICINGKRRIARRLLSPNRCNEGVTTAWPWGPGLVCAEKYGNFVFDYKTLQERTASLTSGYHLCLGKRKYASTRLA